MVDEPVRLPPPSVPPELQAAVLDWYDGRGRTLPFRGVDDPYLILVSELMAQQTQVARAAEAWTTFTRRFPTIESVAAATPADVLRAWRGLGYNRRALGLWRTARVVVADHGGRLPDDVAELQRLPGIGPYTARAIAALAFGRPVGAVDTNVRRVLGRIVARDPAAMTARALQAVADAAVPPDRPGDWTHALMDVGATVCKPRRPQCHACPAVAWCRAAATGVVHRVADGPAPLPRAAVASHGRHGNGTPGTPFPATSRWLRGRILDRLRDAPAEVWTAFDAPIGDHDPTAVAATLRILAGEGLVELDGSSPVRARLPIA